jgi:hypothetical protein
LTLHLAKREESKPKQINISNLSKRQLGRRPRMRASVPVVPASKEVAMIELKELSRGDIAHRAYELYTQRGCEAGNDIEDWVRAEKELASEVVVGSAKTMAA